MWYLLVAVVSNILFAVSDGNCSCIVRVCARECVAAVCFAWARGIGGHCRDP